MRRGDASATQVVADHLDHIARPTPTLGAFRAVRGGEAIAEAEKVDEQEDLANLPLAGVPVAVKENTAGRRPAHLERLGGRPRTRSPRRDHEVVRRLRGAGAVVVGVTRMPELGLWALTDDETAVTRNPWRMRPDPGRLLRRRRRRGRRRPGADRARQRRPRARSGSRPPAAGWSG